MVAFTLSYIFLITGIILLMVEVVTPGFFIAIPGSALLVIGLIGVAVPDMPPYIALLAAIVVTIPMTLVTIKIYKKISPPMPPTTTVGDSLVGKVGIVTMTVVPDSISGKVKIENTTWSARTESNNEIPRGAKVKVISSSGVHVVVSEIKEVKIGKRQV